MIREKIQFWLTDQELATELENKKERILEIIENSEPRLTLVVEPRVKLEVDC